MQGGIFREENIGRARLLLGDCREALPTLPEWPIITDPPYGIGFRFYGTHNDNEAEYASLIAPLRGRKVALLQYPEEMMRLVCPVLGAPDEVLAWCYGSNLPRQFRLWGLWGLDCDFRAVKQPARNPEVKKVKNTLVASYDWWEQPQVKNTSADKTPHPCQIPVSSVERVARLTGVEHFIDPFLGSGTSAIAAMRLGLPFVGVETDPAYFDIACKRIEDAQRQGDFFVEAAA
jgi:DNA modification methylase